MPYEKVVFKTKIKYITKEVPVEKEKIVFKDKIIEVENTQKIANLRIELAKLQNKLALLQEDKNTEKTSISKLNIKITNLKTKLSKAKNSLIQKDELISFKNTSLKDKDNKIKKLNTKINDLSAQIKIAKKSNSTLLNEVALKVKKLKQSNKESIIIRDNEILSLKTKIKELNQRKCKVTPRMYNTLVRQIRTQHDICEQDKLLLKQEIDQLKKYFQ